MPTSRKPIYRWPNWMDAPLVEGYSVSTEDRRVLPDFELNSQFRVEFNTDQSAVSCILHLNALQSNWFEAFERDLLKQGARWFLIDLWIGGQLVEHRARFKDRPEANSREGEEWIQYAFQLDIVRREGLKKLAAVPDGEFPRWPETMPVPLIDGYSVKPQDRRVKTDMDAGSQFRIKVNTDETVSECTLLLDEDQANWFEAFERDVLKQGSRWFLMPLWVAGRMVEQRVRFAGRPQSSKEPGPYTIYSFQLDVARREGLMDEGLTELLLEFDPMHFARLEGRLQIIVNVRFPKSLPFIAA